MGEPGTALLEQEIIIDDIPQTKVGEKIQNNRKFSPEQRKQLENNYFVVRIKGNTVGRFIEAWSWTDHKDFIEDKTGASDAFGNRTSIISETKSPFVEVAIPKQTLKLTNDTRQSYEEWQATLEYYGQKMGISDVDWEIVDPATYIEIFDSRHTDIGKTTINTWANGDEGGVPELQHIGGIPTTAIDSNGLRVYFSVHLTDVMPGESYHGPHFITNKVMDKFNQVLPVIIPR